MGNPARPSTATIARLALAYWAGIFAAGFVLGALRVSLIAPRIGALGAVACELPVMLALSWALARHLMRGRGVTRGQALAMGLLAFALLMASELALGRFGFRLSAGEWARQLLRPEGLLGLAGQAAFTLMPRLVSRR